MGRESRQLAGGTMVLTIANILSRGLGLAFRVVMVSMAGAGAIGLFQMTFPIYFIALVVATGGIPTVVAKLVAENPAVSASKTVKIALRLVLGCATVASAVLFLGNKFIATKIFVDPRTRLALIVLGFAIPFDALAAVLRGYLQGKRQMGRMAIVQVLEQVVYVTVSLSLLLVYKDKGPAYIAAALAGGVVAGDVVSLMAMYGIYKRRSPPVAPISMHITTYTSIMVLAWPLSLSRLLISANQAISASLIPHRLILAGYSIESATVAFAELSGMALTLLFAPSMLIMALVHNLIPAISYAHAQRQRHNLIRLCVQAYRLVLMIGLPAGFIFALQGPRICWLLFANESAGQILSILSLGAIFIYAQQISSAVLQGLGKMTLAATGAVVSTLLTIVGVWFFTPIWGINGTAFAFCLSFVLGGSLQTLFVNSHIDFMPLVGKTLIRICFALLASLLVWLLLPPSSVITLLGTSLLSGSIFIFILYVLGERLTIISKA